MRSARLLLLVTLLSASQAALAADGAPEELIGHWGKNPKECMSYHRKFDGLTTISKEYLTSCGGSACEARIVSYKRKGKSYVLHLVSPGTPEGWDSTYTKVDEGVFESGKETFVSCTVKDAIAGIGRYPEMTGGSTASLEVLFGAYYALAVPSVCPAFKADTKAAKALADAGVVRWLQFLAEIGSPRPSPEAEMASIRRDTKARAEGAVIADSKEIPDFCDHVLDVFGLDGTLYPNLLLYPRKKA
ncbi:hypothetical protein [Pleomorphomonas sp. T1.2MG-36]|uniref:hypothetical protein n=1 Tax=Pleomorphomonas sp. T1.2MG-36 TaxID=3041167 RepID=UPI0025423376|nr:hypothetical protein [Pleomorphomonas sp. T1.2MG-36]